MPRRYDATLRAQKAAENEQRILDEAERLFRTELFDRVTLGSVAEAAGVTIPTLQRRFGNKEGLFMACGQRLGKRVQAQRGTPPVDDIPAALAQLIEHYEAEGAWVFHMLRQENDVPLLKPALEHGRLEHRLWVEKVFEARLRWLGGARRAARVDQLVAVTDLFVWKLLRVDLGRPRKDVEASMLQLALAVSKGSSP
jgi:AcrR family transcriptional regulator